MARTDKSAAIAELKEKFESSDAVLLTEYRGLTVMQLKTLRRAIGANAQFKVAKNTLAKIAAKEAGIEGLDDLPHSPSSPVKSPTQPRPFAISPRTIRHSSSRAESLRATCSRRTTSRSLLISSLARCSSARPQACSRLLCSRRHTFSRRPSQRRCAPSTRCARKKKRLPDRAPRNQQIHLLA